ncbi:MAG: deoxynucleoside kinase [Oscillospiraceae bacterium]|nr:deoxynucleoside kinase [Oscillospiraceae bacterium]
MQGNLIVIEGIDGSGKSTQYRKLVERLENEGREFRKIVFPRYDKDSSALVREYLRGGFGTNPDDVNAYAASTFYAVDRFASFKTDWGEYYKKGGLVLSDRYTTSNACHQGSKVKGEERVKYLNWLYDFEFNLLGLPAPSLVIYLNIDIEVSRRQMEARQNATNTEADIHEKDFDYLASCLEAGRFAAKTYGWKIIDCVRDGEMRSIEDIHEEIYRAVIGAIE